MGRVEVLVLVASLQLGGAEAVAQEGSCRRASFPPAPPAEVGMDAGALEELASVVAGYIEDGSVVGAELLVIKKGRTVLHEAFGWRDREGGLPMERNTIFNVRSMTKPLVGAVAQMLVDEGRLSTADRVARYLPGFDTEASRDVTVEQLLTHRAGLPVSVVTRVDEYPDLMAMGNAAGAAGPVFEPGSRFWYSDAGADALGAVLERVGGMPLEELLVGRLFEPLGMEDTFGTAGPGDPRWGRVASLYVGRRGLWSRAWRSEGRSLYPFVWGSQGVFSTPMDYARFVSLWLNGGACGGETLMSEAAVRRTLTPVSTMTAMGSDLPQPTFFSDLEVRYGQMALLHTRAGAPGSEPEIVGHSGSDGTIVWAWPDQDLMVLYFTQSRGTTSYLRLERSLERMVLDPDGTHETPDPARLEPFVGRYLASFGPFRNVAFEVYAEDGYLAVDVPGQFSTELRDPDDTGRWVSVLVPTLSVSFERDDSGVVTAMTWHDGNESRVLPREKATVEAPLDPAVAAPCLGWYRDPDTGNDVEVALREGRLVVLVPGAAAPVELDGPDAAGFWHIRLNPAVRIRFDRDETGEVVSYTVHAPDGATYVRPRIGERAPAPRQAATPRRRYSALSAESGSVRLALRAGR